MSNFIFIHIVLNPPPKVNGFSRKYELYIPWENRDKHHFSTWVGKCENRVHSCRSDEWVLSTCCPACGIISLFQPFILGRWTRVNLVILIY